MTDYATALSEDTVRIERSLPGPIERVWAYLTESDKRATWFARGPMELRAGGKVELTWENDRLSDDDSPPPARYADKKVHSLTGRVLEVDPPRLLSFQWGGDADSIATFELTPQGGRVNLVITHSRLSGRQGQINVSGGWHSHLGILEDVLEGRSPRPFWKNFTKLEAEYEARL